jgi:hypothetical protein
MSIFNFFRKKKESPLDTMMDGMMNNMLPKGQKDIDAGTDELLRIIKFKANHETASNIFVKAIAISRIAENFNEERLRIHLKGYAIEYFTDREVHDFFNYLMALKNAMLIHRKTPSEIYFDGSGSYSF